MKRIVATIIAVAAGVGLYLTWIDEAQAYRCTTAQANCSGRATIGAPSNSWRCVTIFWANNSGIRNFCLRPGDREIIQARTGDSICWVNANHAPPNNCSRQPIEVD